MSIELRNEILNLDDNWKNKLLSETLFNLGAIMLDCIQK